MLLVAGYCIPNNSRLRLKRGGPRLRIVKHSFLLFLLLVGAASSGAAQAVGDRAKKALDGDASAQISLGESYRLGLGVDQNYAEARRFYKLAAAQGAPQAQFALAEMNRFGEGSAPDYAEAVRLYKLAAAQGLPEAQFGLGVMYDNGQGSRGITRKPCAGTNSLRKKAWRMPSTTWG